MTTKVQKENLIALKGVMKHRFRSIKANVDELTLVQEVDHNHYSEANVDVAFFSWGPEEDKAVLSLYQLSEKSQSNDVLSKLPADDPSAGIFVFDPNQSYFVETAQLAMSFLGAPEKLDPSRFFRWGSSVLRQSNEPSPSQVNKELANLRSIDSVTVEEALRPIQKIESYSYHNDGEVRGVCLKSRSPANWNSIINTMTAIANITILVKSGQETLLLLIEPNNYHRGSVKRNFLFLDVSLSRTAVSSISDAS